MEVVQTAKINKIDNDKISIALHHVPIDWEIFKEHGIELILADHTHGGQFLSFNILVKIVFHYLRGIFKYIVIICFFKMVLEL